MVGEAGTSKGRSVLKNAKGKIVHSGQRKRIINLYEELKENQPKMKYVHIISNIVQKTGIGAGTVKQTIAEFKHVGTVSSPNTKKARLTLFEKLTEDQKVTIRRKVHEMWMQNQNPTVMDILSTLHEEGLPDFKRVTLWKMLKQLDFRYIRRARNSALIEKDFIIAWRQRYIDDIRRYRAEDRKIFFLDETWINTGDTSTETWQDMDVQTVRDALKKDLTTGPKESSGKGKRLIVLHIGSADGFLPGGLLCFESKNFLDYHDELSSKTFYDWFVRIQRLLPENAVVVMDNAPYHSQKFETRPNSSWKREEIKKWLISKGYEVSDRFIKNTLMQMVRECPVKNKYVIDELAKEHGKTILRLPPYHCELNPIELAWAMVRAYVMRKNRQFTVPAVKKLLEEGLERVTPDMWRKFIDHAINMEEKFDAMDLFLETLQEDAKDDSDITSEDDI